jgi:hypothetical protein
LGGNGIGDGSATNGPAALAVTALIAKADATTINATTVRFFIAFLRLCDSYATNDTYKSGDEKLMAYCTQSIRACPEIFTPDEMEQRSCALVRAACAAQPQAKATMETNTTNLTALLFFI